MLNKMKQGQLVRSLFLNGVATWAVFCLKQAYGLRASGTHHHPNLPWAANVRPIYWSRRDSISDWFLRVAYFSQGMPGIQALGCVLTKLIFHLCLSIREHTHRRGKLKSVKTMIVCRGNSLDISQGSHSMRFNSHGSNWFIANLSLIS